MKAKIVLSVIIFLTASLNSQYKNLFPSLKNNPVSVSDSTESNTLITKTDECDIYLKDRTKILDVPIVGMIDSSVKIETGNNFKYINIKDINKIRFQKSSDFWTGALIGAAISFTYCGFVGAAAHDNEGKGWAFFIGLLSIVPGGLIGGLIGAASTPDDYIYDFSRGNPDAKLKRLRYIIDKLTPLFKPAM
jgi:hypothetical protein